MKTSRAFTLIETIMYLALFSLLMGGAVITAYNLFESSSRAHSIAVLQEEGDYLMGKIGWVLYGAEAITTPAAGGAGTTLTVAKWVAPVGENPYVLALSGTDITLARGSAAAQVLNNDDVWLSGLTFTHTLSSGDGINPESLRTAFTLSIRTPNGAVISRTFSGISYIRQ